MRRIIAFILLTAAFIVQPYVQVFTALAASDYRGLTVTKRPTESRRRIALVIGNSTYASSPLKNAANDARAMAATLRRLHFEVKEKTNIGYISMNEAVEDFGRELRNGGVGLFFYAGHGMQVNGSNYLIPVDMEISNENEVRYKAVDAGLVLAKMEQSKSDVNIVILDACRDNPFARSFRSTSRGLATMDAPSGTFIAYATGPGKTAADGDGKNGLFTAELVKVMEEPELKLEDVFKRATKAVREKSRSRQTPWTSSSLEGDFWFVAKYSEPDDERVVQEKQRLAEEKKKLAEEQRKFREKQKQAEQKKIEKEMRAEQEKKEMAAIEKKKQREIEREKEVLEKKKEEDLKKKLAEEQRTLREKQKQAEQEKTEKKKRAEQEKREMAARAEEQQREIEREREALEMRKEEELRQKAAPEVDKENQSDRKVIKQQFIPIPSL